MLDCDDMTILIQEEHLKYLIMVDGRSLYPEISIKFLK